MEEQSGTDSDSSDLSSDGLNHMPSSSVKRKFSPVKQQGVSHSPKKQRGTETLHGNKKSKRKEPGENKDLHMLPESSNEESGSSSVEGEEENSDSESAPADEQPEDKQLAAIKKELSEMPLEDLIKIKEKLGLKAFNKIMFGDKFENKRKVFKRDNKNRPMEISAKRKVPLLRHHDVPKEKVRRDPRFDDLSGEFKDEHFQRNFSFLSDVKAREKQLVQKKLQKTTNEKKKEDLSKLLNKMTQSEQKEEREKKQADLEKSWKSKEKELVKEGKTPYFLKKGDRKKLELAERYRDLQKTGKLDQYLSKKHKRNAQKDRRKLPNRHDRYT
ncbi:ribosomal RNA processing protein 36 homolog isoform X1 [Mya arenaria]|uniref:ribosomal RNA processing protein 36 homolog isoform X1 n=1 Tax=Mya arenaria TaxID=6604 RepID=UPI0022E1DAA7|nr:ribosomal RNA processing protein 36 homolog isoform X1 [Mya arenaria]